MFVQDEQGYNQIFPKRGTSVLRAQRRADWFNNRLRAAGARDAVEFGCGLGQTAFHVASKGKMNVLAVDISERFITEAQTIFSLPNLEFKVLDLLSENLPALARTDAFFGNGVLHHLIPRLPETLRRMRSLVNDGGSLAFIEPNLRNPICRFLFGTKLGRRLGHLEPQEMAFVAEDIESLLADSGWTDIEIVTGDFLLPGLPRIFTSPSVRLENMLENSSVKGILGQSHFIFARAD